MVNERQIRSSRLRRTWSGVRAGLLCVAAAAAALFVLPATAASQSEMLERAAAAYDAGRYERVLSTLEPLSRQDRDARPLLLLGKAYGRMAENSPWYEAVTYARRCGRYLERAVAADPMDPDAVRALARFLEQAPALVGGDVERARRLRLRLQTLGHAS